MQKDKVMKKQLRDIDQLRLSSILPKKEFKAQNKGNRKTFPKLNKHRYSQKKQIFSEKNSQKKKKYSQKKTDILRLSVYTKGQAEKLKIK